MISYFFLIWSRFSRNSHTRHSAHSQVNFRFHSCGEGSKHTQNLGKGIGSQVTTRETGKWQRNMSVALLIIVQIFHMRCETANGDNISTIGSLEWGMVGSKEQHMPALPLK